LRSRFRKRGDYGGLAGCRAPWKEALKERNMLQSQQVLEWQAEGEARGRIQSLREVLRNLLEDRFGALPEVVLGRINSAEDVSQLASAVRQAYKIQSPDELPL